MISVIILHHDKARYSEACLRSLRCSSYRPLEIVNVDNGSRDDTPQVLDEHEREAKQAGIATRRLTFESNIGAVRGRNEAFAAASGEYLALLDNDVIVAQADWLERLQAFLDADAKRWIVVPKLLFPWAPFDVECCGVGVSQRGRIQYIGRGEAQDVRRDPQSVQCAISAAWLMRRATLNRVGPLDEAYSPVQYEDFDFCYRARQLGGEVWTLPDVALFHFEHTTTAGSDDINFRYVTSKNGLLFKKKWGDVFAGENGPSEAETAWQSLPKQGIEDVEWQSLLPR